MAGEIVVDAQAIAAVAGRISSVRNELEGSEWAFGPQACLQDGRITEALEWFDDHWSYKRDELIKHLTEAAASLDNVATTFTGADTALAQELGD